jgi:uncharacterized protein (DUF58 family)
MESKDQKKGLMGWLSRWFDRSEQEELSQVQSLKELVNRVGKYEIRIRKAVNSQMQGDFHSVFKGTGLEFDDVRAYQYGDDVRHIDWNVSAKGHGAFVKTFKEEKEQHIFFMLDVSESQQIGQMGQQKMDVAREICGILLMSGIKEQSSVGLLCFTDEKERYIKANKGVKHGYFLLSEILKLRPKSKLTNLDSALRFTLATLKRKSIIVIISDFLDDGYERHLKAMAQKHDLVCIHLVDPSETEMPNVGIAPVVFKESGEKVYLNTASAATRERMEGYYAQKREMLHTLCMKTKASYLEVNTQEDFVPQLIKLFKIRNMSKKK